MEIAIQEGTRKTASNFLKTIKKNINGSLKYFCGGFEKLRLLDTQKDLFQQGQRNIFAIENRIASYAMLNFEIA